MRLIAFVDGRPRPQPRITQKVKFLFSDGKSEEYWQMVDDANAIKAKDGLINKKGNPYKPTRYAYRYKRLLQINEYRLKVHQTVSGACGGHIPAQFLFFFYLFHVPKSWSKKKAKRHEWQFHEVRPDYSNLLKGTEDSLYKNDSRCNAVAHYKIYVPREFKEGLLILQDEEIHRHVLEIAIDGFLKKMI
jgi:Holliday junction resolvase RusA-like endonuclease